MGTIDRNRQKATISEITGLTPQQEQACVMLASGEGFTAVADKLNLNRGTLYKWLQHPAFQCYFNRQCQDYIDEVKNGLLGLHTQAITTIKTILEKGSEAARLKTAMWLVEKVEAVRVGNTDIREMLRRKCSHTIFDTGSDVILDEQEYNDALEELGLNADE
jgi:malate/lactate dehydrogenase